MTKPFGVGLLAAAALALSASAAFADYQLNILHFNDFHSRVESINKFDATCSAAEESKNECFGGSAAEDRNRPAPCARLPARTSCCSRPATISRARCSTRPYKRRSRGRIPQRHEALTS